MNPYKDKLNLPQTDFPMRANLTQREPQQLAYWETLGLYKRLQEQRCGRKQFILHDGPPYANGDIHMGHAVNKVIKDIIIKSRLLDGMDVPYIPGWDCHGLPIELEVEKKFKKAQGDVRAFRKRCRDYAQSQVEKQKAGFIRLGVLGDWEHPYQSMDYATEANILRVLAQAIRRGYFYHGMRPVLWCLECASSLAEAEVDYKDKQSTAIDCLFPVVDTAGLAKAWGLPQNTPLAFAVWTTTPWTLPSNQAVAIHPAYDYVVVDTGKHAVVVAEELLPAWLERCGLMTHHILKRVRGDECLKALATCSTPLLHHAFLAREVPLLGADFVTLDAGSGLVHIAPAHGLDDHMLGRQQGLSQVCHVDSRGVYDQSIAEFAGMSVRQCDEAVVSALKKAGNLLVAKPHTHSYPHCWRHKTPVIYRATPQWFLNVREGVMGSLSLREQAIKACEQVEWTPSWGKERLQGMLEGRPDWCLSRQRQWGVPIALLVHKETHEPHPESQRLLEEVAQRIEREGIQGWFDLAVSDLIDQDVDAYEKVQDVLDVWFDSGSSCGSILRQRPELRAPADLYLEGSDQHRGWFQSSLLVSLAAFGEAPYRGVLTHGFVVDADGKKMSKSRKNVISPNQIIKQHGADVLRLWVAATDFSSEMNLSEEILERMSEAYRRIRNTARFLLGNLFDFSVDQDGLEEKNLLALDAWMMVETNRIQEQIRTAYQKYAFHQVYQLTHHFCSVTLGGFYLDIVKDRLYTTQAQSHARRSAQMALEHIVQALVRWIAPILSFTAEEIYRALPQTASDSIFMCEWYGGRHDHAALKQAMRFTPQQWSEIIALRQGIMKHLETLRQKGEIGSSLDAEVRLFCSEHEFYTLLEELGEEIRFIMLTSSVELCADKPQGSEEVITGVFLQVRASQAAKCQRCWHHCMTVGTHHEDNALCARCVTNVYGQGEKRHYA